jgi:hypothetical protein
MSVDSLAAPQRRVGVPREAIYGAVVETPSGAGSAKLSVDRGTGLLARWVGPALVLPT